MRFGLQLDTYDLPEGENHWERLLAVARLAEELGFESVWYEDHFMFRDDEDGPRHGNLECLTTLAASTERVGIGALVAGAPYRNPALLAKMWTTIDVISGGRAIVGLGAGWHEQEFRAYGFPFGTLAERMEKLEDAARIVAAMTIALEVTVRGSHSSVERALNHPPPVQRPRPPILIGGNGERRTLRLVARHADMCNVYGSTEDVARKFEVLWRHCEEAGRPYDEVTRTINYWALMGRDEAEKAAKRERYPNAFSVDTPEETISLLKQDGAAGTQLAIVKILDAAELEPVRVFAESVLPAFAAGGQTP